MRKFLYLVLITLSHLFIFSSIISTASAQAFKSGLQFQLGDNVKVFAKKAIRRKNGEVYEAIGNVVIIHENDTLYGQVAHFNTKTGLIELDGNVRLVNKDLTLNGSNIKYFSKSKNVEIKNARLTTQLYKIIARDLKKISEKKYIATDAEYTTCKDCPESWTIYGNQVQIDIGKYIRVNKAILRIKGVDFAYFPYFIFPIKTQRQTGFLLPHFRGGNTDGLAVFQPFFWAINQSMDATITPAYWSNRGPGGDLEYRYASNSESLFDVNTRLISDRQTRASAGKSGRYHSKVEVFQKISQDFQFHIRAMDLSDINFITEQPDFSRDKINQTEFGVQGNVHYRKDPYTIGANFLKQKSMLVNNSFFYKNYLDYSDNTVALLPSFYLNFTPVRLYQGQSDFFNLVHYGGKINYDIFSQGEFNNSVIANNSAIRNAKRLNLKPYLAFTVYDNDVMSVDSKYEFDLQHYSFRDDSQKNFYKYSGVLENSFSFELEKVFGRSNLKKVAYKTEEKENSDSDYLIGDFKSYKDEFGFNFDVVNVHSYKHLQKFKLNHFWIPKEKNVGNAQFANQITNRSGWFDFYDSIRSQEYFLGNEETRKQLPKSNTLELRWENDIIRKQVMGKDVYKKDQDYIYNRVSHFHISQGYIFQNDLYPNSELTRLLVSGGHRFSRKLQVGLEHYYFYTDKSHISDFYIRNDFNFIKVLNRFSINDFSKRANYKLGFDINFSDVLVARVEEERDLIAKELIEREFSVFFLPRNRCWFTSVSYFKTKILDGVSIDFAVNLGQENFKTKLKRLF